MLYSVHAHSADRHARRSFRRPRSYDAFLITPYGTHIVEYSVVKIIRLLIKFELIQQFLIYHFFLFYAYFCRGDITRLYL